MKLLRSMLLLGVAGVCYDLLEQVNARAWMIRNSPQSLVMKHG